VLQRFLSGSDHQVLQDERSELTLLRSTLARLDATAADLGVLDRALEQLDGLFLLVVVGEFNAGKSAIINALLGERFLGEGATPTTTQIHLLKYGEQAGQSQDEADTLVLTFPADWLRDINIVDTPGTNAVLLRHQQITEDFVPRADLIIFVTSADRPFSESERAFLERIRAWGKKVVMVVNKIDILETPADAEAVLQFVQSHGRDLLGIQPMVFPVSARQARLAKETIDADERTRLWTSSQFGPLETFVEQKLDERERWRLKLANPLGVARRLAEQYLDEVRRREELLQVDVATIQTIETGLADYERDMRAEFKYHLTDIDNVLYAMAERGDRFFDSTIRWTRLLDLLNAERVRGMFEREVVADTTASVEARTDELIDWIVSQNYRQWQTVMDYLNRRAAQHEDQIIGAIGSQFEYNRQALLQSVGRAAEDAVSSYDKELEARNLAESVQAAVAQTALVEVGAIGLGALLIKLLATTLADVSGILAASAVAALGLYLIPNKRRRAKSELHSRLRELRHRLAGAITAQFERELVQALARVRTAIRPYQRFVETQQAGLAASEAALQTAQQRLQALWDRVARLGTP
jgi:small GTP-binding protein